MKTSKMRILIIVFTFLLGYSYNAFSQQKDTLQKRNTIYFEALGQGLFNSLNYDRILKINSKSATTFTVGISNGGYLFSASGLSVRTVGIPVSYNYLLRRKSHNLELGMGATYENIKTDFTGDNIEFIYLNLKTGYRYQKPEGGFFFRVTLTPLIPIYVSDFYSVIDDPSGTDLPFVIIPWAGISFGYTF